MSIFFRKRSISESDTLEGITDYHCHILPGVDDGVRTNDEALGVLDYFESMGIRKVVVTPHIMADYPLNEGTFIKEKFQSLCNTYQGSIELELGGEYMLDDTFEERLAKNDLFTIFDDHLLVETSYMYSPTNFYELIKKIQSKGYHVILAHPERYMYMETADYQLLKQNDVRFQLNILSLVGGYGRQAQHISEKLLNKDYYNFIGSDLHNLQSFDKWVHKKQLSAKVINKLNLLKYT